MFREAQINYPFPDPLLADSEGLVAYGGDLHPERLLSAYASGIFPWFNEKDPILWWSPDPRMIMFPKDFRRPKSLRLLVNKGVFRVTFDRVFESVIHSCASIPRSGQDGTWITEDMKQAYIRLHRLGWAHSVEVWEQNELVGGLYGVSMGGAFFGESMFHTRNNASRIALWYLTDLMLARGMPLLDVQQDTAHLRNQGAVTVSRKDFINLLHQSLLLPSHQGTWNIG